MMAFDGELEHVENNDMLSQTEIQTIFRYSDSKYYSSNLSEEVPGLVPVGVATAADEEQGDRCDRDRDTDKDNVGPSRGLVRAQY